MSSTAALVKARLPALDHEAVVEERGAAGDGVVEVFVVKPQDLVVLASFLRRDRDAAFDCFVDACVVERGPRLWWVVCLASRAHETRLQIRCVLDEDDPGVPTLTGEFPPAWSAEREAWELFGVTPHGHPSLRRTLLPAGFAGHPGLARYRLHKAQPQVRPAEHPARVVVGGEP